MSREATKASFRIFFNLILSPQKLGATQSAILKESNTAHINGDIYIKFLILSVHKAGNVRINVILSRVHVNNVAVEKQRVCCVFSLS
jgi:hypothetical protein